MSEYSYKGRPLRALFLGNHDNINLRTAIWSRNVGIDAHLLFLGDENGPRSRVSDLADAAPGRLPDWIRAQPARTVTAQLREISGSKELQAYFAGFDVAVTSGTISLQIASAVPLPKIHVSVGIEIAGNPFHVPRLPPPRGFPRTPRQLASRVLDVLVPARVRDTNDVLDDERLLAARTRAGLESVQRIFDGYVPNMEALERLGLSEKLVVSSIGEDVFANRARIDQVRRAALIAEYAKVERVFLWLSRLNFLDPEHGQAYKGVERYWAALERRADLVRSGRVALVFGRHGNDSDRFIEQIKDSPLYPHVRWVPHLGWAELLTWVSHPKAYVFSEFGERQKDMSGLGRDAISVGTPVVSSADHDHVRRQLGEKPPFLRAVTIDDITARIDEIVGYDAAQDNALREKVRLYGETVLHYPAYMRRLWSATLAMLEGGNSMGTRT
jgi:hypothetical protein